jgi:hypothetical protein
MILKRLIKYVLSVVFVITSANGMDDDTSLIIGCRPWDQNMQAFSGLESANFIDFMVEHTNAPSQLPQNFHHIDVNDTKMYASGSLSDFANSHQGAYNNVIVDWATFQHIRENSAWANFSKILADNGTLSIPVASISFKEGPVSQQKAEELIETGQLRCLFQKVEILSAKDVLHEPQFALLRRPNLPEEQKNYFVNTMQAVIIKAIK